MSGTKPSRKRFDSGYFDKWYRHPKHRVGTQADLARLVRFALAATEYVLAHPVRSVLDVGAGEGRWFPVLQKMRPRIRYQGVDPSDYAVRRFGERRNIVRGTLDDLPGLFPDAKFDLVVCCSVINYMPSDEVVRAMRNIAARTAGVAYLEIFTTDDHVEGDTEGWHSETRTLYRRMIREAGLIPCGLHCYVPGTNSDALVELERA
ncbi:MAG: class I SAM-dependent methyltransferase [Gemmatimonadota bacterium]|nr:class I SAM-dependent methyltransferase [Gemmatimonadota bacterium]